MERYSVIAQKHPREIVLLKSFPCVWGKCTFCDYIDDNTQDEAAMTALNAQVLSRVTGCTGTLEVINSGSCFELPQSTLLQIRRILHEKQIRRLFLESHWVYRKRLQEMRAFMGVPIVFKIGVETFDNGFREHVLHKHALFQKPEDVAAWFDSPCLLVGIQGQTREMIDRDIHILKKHFRMGTVNIFTNNTTPVRRDPDLVNWFSKKYACLRDDLYIEVLYENTDFGVGK